MNGFILHFGDDKKGEALSRLRTSGYEEKKIKKIKFAEKLTFYGWGCDPGDIQCSKNEEISFLILNGYLTSIMKSKESKKQKNICDLLLEELDCDHSNANLVRLSNYLNGSFSIIYIPVKERKVYCITDRISSRPTWIKRSLKGWFISSNVNAITTSTMSSEYELGALGAFLVYGGHIEPTKSIYRDICALSEATVAILYMEGQTYFSKWLSFHHTPDETITFKGWVQLLANALKKSAMRVLETSRKPMVFFSGGVDSRIAASALRAVGGEPLLVTLSDHENLEVRAARSAANALKCEHHVEIRDSSWYLRAMPNAVYQSGGSFVWNHSHFYEAYVKYRQKFGIDVAMLGDFSEAFSKLMCSSIKTDRFWTSQEFLSTFDELHLPLYRPPHKEKTLSLINPDAYSNTIKALNEDITARYNNIKHISNDPAFVCDYYFRWQCASALPTFQMFYDLRSAGSERNIMFDNDIIRILQSMPSSMRNGANLGVKIIEALWKPAANAINSNTGLPMNWPKKLQELTKAVKPILGKVRRRFINDSYMTQGAWPKKSLLYLKDPNWRKFLNQLLDQKELFDKDVFDYKAINQCWKEFCNGDIELAVDVEKLANIAIQKQMHCSQKVIN